MGGCRRSRLAHPNDVRRQSLAIFLAALERCDVHMRARWNGATTMIVHSSLFLARLPIEMLLRHVFGQMPRSRQGFVCSSKRIGRNVRSDTRPRKDLVALRFVYGEARRRGLVQHPFERDLGEAALGFAITAAHIAMNAGKPHLLQILRAVLPLLRIWRHAPQMVAEECAALVDRN